MHVFVDESERNAYLVCAVLVPPAELAQRRAAMRRLLCRGERRLHFNNERPARRRELLSALVTEGFRTRLYSCGGGAVSARDSCLTQLVCDLSEVSAPVRLILESRSEVRDGQDRNTIATAQRTGLAPGDFTYEHLRPHEEPLLWPADGICWAYGAGGDWRRRIESLMEAATMLDEPRQREARRITVR